MDAKQFMVANEADRRGPKHEPFSRKVDALVRCFNCEHFDRSKTWSVGISKEEAEQASADGVEILKENGFYRKLTEISKDGRCLKMSESISIPVDTVHYQTTSGNQWNYGTQAPRVGENFGCIHFSPNVPCDFRGNQTSGMKIVRFTT